jgi:hypothetical protein
MIIIPIAIAVTITLLVLGTMSSGPSPGNKMVLHNHATLNVIQWPNSSGPATYRNGKCWESRGPVVIRRPFSRQVWNGRDVTTAYT